MAGTANTAIGSDKLQYHIPEKWAQEAIGYFPQYLNLINTVTVDYSDEVKVDGDTVHVPKRGTLSVNDKVRNQNVQRQQPEDDEVQFTLNKHKEVTFAAEDFARITSRPDVFKGYMEDAARKIAEQVESDLAALYASAGSTLNAGSAVEIADLRAARRTLITNKVPQNAYIFGYLDEYAVEDLPLTDASVLGTNKPVFDGAIAKLGGVNIFEAQGVKTSGSPTSYHCMVYTKEAMALVLRALPLDAESFGGATQTVVTDPQTGLSIRVTMSYDANMLAPQVTLDVLYGVGVLNSEFLIDMYHTNA